MKKLTLILLFLIASVSFICAQTMNIQLNDLGPIPGSNEVYVCTHLSG